MFAMGECVWGFSEDGKFGLGLGCCFSLRKFILMEGGDRESWGCDDAP